MSHWTFVIAAYGLTLAATAVLIGLSYFGMRRDERRAEQLKRDR